MGYTVYVFRKEVKENNEDLSFLENGNLITPFSNEQFISLKERLLRYGYEIENSTEETVTFNFKGGQLGISAMLTKNQLSFSSGFTENGVAEISLTASEIIDSGDLVKYDPQDGQWEQW